MVQRLMNAGWYRVGQQETPTGVQWGFRQGHTLDDSPAQEHWIAADDEMEAMRSVWKLVCTERVREAASSH